MHQICTHIMHVIFTREQNTIFRGWIASSSIWRWRVISIRYNSTEQRTIYLNVITPFRIRQNMLLLFFLKSWWSFILCMYAYVFVHRRMSMNWMSSVREQNKYCHLFIYVVAIIFYVVHSTSIAVEFIQRSTNSRAAAKQYVWYLILGCFKW